MIDYTIIILGGIEWTIPIKDIIFIERIKNKKWIRIVLYDIEHAQIKGMEFFGVTLKGVLEQIDNKKELIMCHKSFIVNPKKIKGIDTPNKLIILKHTDEIIPFSNTYKNNLKV